MWGGDHPGEGCGVVLLLHNTGFVAAAADKNNGNSDTDMRNAYK